MPSSRRKRSARTARGNGGGKSPTLTGNGHGFVTALPGTEGRQTATRGVATRARSAKCPEGVSETCFPKSTPPVCRPPDTSPRHGFSARTTAAGRSGSLRPPRRPVTSGQLKEDGFVSRAPNPEPRAPSPEPREIGSGGSPGTATPTGEDCQPFVPVTRPRDMTQCQVLRPRDMTNFRPRDK